MFSFTNYSVFYITELKYRLFYIFLNFSIIGAYTIYYFNFFILLLLKPIDFFIFDFHFSSLIHFIGFNLGFNFYDNNNLNTDLIVSDSFREMVDMTYDYYPIFEVNINSNTSLYLYIFQYFIFIFIFPILFYQIYLFFLPGLYVYEVSWLKKKYVFFFFLFFIFTKYINNFLISLYFFFTFNNYYEFYNYEFDIEFNFLSFIKWHLLILFLFYINTIFFLFFSNKKNDFLKILLILINFYLTPFFFIFFFIFIFYLNDFVLLFLNQITKL